MLKTSKWYENEIMWFYSNENSMRWHPVQIETDVIRLVEKPLETKAHPRACRIPSSNNDSHPGWRYNETTSWMRWPNPCGLVRRMTSPKHKYCATKCDEEIEFVDGGRFAHAHIRSHIAFGWRLSICTSDSHSVGFFQPNDCVIQFRQHFIAFRKWNSGEKSSITQRTSVVVWF